jgi:hypothetical protein
MTEMYRRRIRVEGKPEAIDSNLLTVHDADTGEQLTHVAAIDMHLEVGAVSTATVQYYEEDEHGKLALDNGKPIRKTVGTSNPEVSVTAMETMPLLEQLEAEVKMYREATIARIQRRRGKEDKIRALVLQAMGEVSMCWTGTPQGEFDNDKAIAIADKLMQAIHDYAQ